MYCIINRNVIYSVWNHDQQVEPNWSTLQLAVMSCRPPYVGSSQPIQTGEKNENMNKR